MCVGGHLSLPLDGASNLQTVLCHASVVCLLRFGRHVSTCVSATPMRWQAGPQHVSLFFVIDTCSTGSRGRDWQVPWQLDAKHPENTRGFKISKHLLMICSEFSVRGTGGLPQAFLWRLAVPGGDHHDDDDSYDDASLSPDGHGAARDREREPETSSVATPGARVPADLYPLAPS